jgi:hypothetical protein
MRIACPNYLERDGLVVIGFPRNLVTSGIGKTYEQNLTAGEYPKLSK